MSEKTIELDPGYYHLTRRAGVTEGEFERRTLHWSLPVEQIALVLVDVWGEHYVASHVARTAEITTGRIKPLMQAFRGLGAVVIHAPSPDCARLYAQWGKYAVEAGKSGQGGGGEDWPPAKFRRKEGDYARWARPQDPQDAEFDRIIEERFIQRDVEPQEGDEVIATGEELQRLLEERGLLFLFYAGFAANMCVPFRDYGMRAMKNRGYEVVLIKDCTTAIEVADTADELLLSRAAAVDVEQNIGYTVTAAELLAACQSSRCCSSL